MSYTEEKAINHILIIIRYTLAIYSKPNGNLIGKRRQLGSKLTHLHGGPIQVSSARTEAIHLTGRVT